VPDSGLGAACDHGLYEHAGHPSGEPVLEAAHRPAHLVGPVQIQLYEIKEGEECTV
jgi:hypothetical protein